MSCVLKVSTAGGRLLIASDIEARTEQALLARDHGAAGLRADVLIVPHHGSRTSSTPEFITAVGAATAIFPVGYRNRFQHPRPDVVERYRRSGATVWRTDRDGALITELSASPAQPPRIEAQRRREPRYWHGR